MKKKIEELIKCYREDLRDYGRICYDQSIPEKDRLDAVSAAHRLGLVIADLEKIIHPLNKLKL